MTHRPIRILEDGTRVYASYHRYTPMPEEERKNKVRKPDDPRAVRFHGEWFLPLDVLPDEERVMPETRPDELAYEHLDERGLWHTCDVCERPQAAKHVRRWRKHRGLRP